MNKIWLIILGVVLSQFIFSQEITPENYMKFKTYFKEASFDTLHVYSEKYTFHQTDSLLPILDLFMEDNQPDEDSSFAIARFNMDTSGLYKGYLVGVKRGGGTATYLLIYSEDSRKFEYDILTSSYSFLDGAYELTRNTWIMDADGDENLDIAIIEDIIDFEYPNEYAENVSGTIFRLYTYQDGSFIHAEWPENLLKTFHIKK